MSIPPKSINYYYKLLQEFAKELSRISNEDIEYRNLHTELKNKLINGRSIHKLSFMEFAAYIDQIKIYASETFHIYLKDSNEN